MSRQFKINQPIDIRGDIKSVNTEGLASQEKIQSLPQPIATIQVNAVQSLVAALGDMFAKVDDTLYEMADRAQSNGEQAHYFDSMREVRIKRRGIELAFEQELNHFFTLLPSSNSRAESNGSLEAVNVNTLAILNNDELEEKVAVEAMVVKAQNLHRAVLAPLTFRFDSLIAQSVDQKNNPLDPRQVCAAFGEASQQSKIEIKAKLILFKLFEKTVILTLGKVINCANREMATLGVLPNLNVDELQGFIRSQKRGRSTQSSAGVIGGENPAQSGNSQYQSDESEIQSAHASKAASIVSSGASKSMSHNTNFSMLEELLLRREMGGDNQRDLPSDGNEQVVPQSQLVSALSSLQQSDSQPKNLANQQSSDLRETIANILQKSSRSNQSASTTMLDKHDDNVVNLVGMLFEFILSDPSLCESIKVALGRLQIPILKVAIIDKTFFSKSAHPARKLVNEMAIAGIGINDQGQSAQDNMRDKITEIVNKISDEFDHDLHMFEALLADFSDFVEKESRRSKLVEQRTKDAEEGRAKTEKARQLVDAIVAHRVSNTPLPQVVSIYLHEAWSSVLFLVALREGSESAAWNQAVATMDDLIASVQYRPTPALKDDLKSLLPGLNARLKKGLNLISYNRNEVDKLAAELDKIQHQCSTGAKPAYLVDLERNLSHSSYDAIPVLEAQTDLNSHDPKQSRNDALAGVKQTDSIDTLVSAVRQDIEDSHPEASAQQTAPIPAQEIVDTIDNKADSQLEEQMTVVKNLSIGQWVELCDGNEAKSTRCKLAARLRSADKLIFVNRLGIKIAERTFDQLAMELKEESSRVLSDTLLFDRALESVITDLRNTTKN